MNIKPTVIAIAVFACLASSAQADIVTFTGNTTGGPTFNRLVEDLSALSGVGTAVAYSTYAFSVGTSGSYTFLTTATFDPFTFLYGPSFNPASPFTGALVGDDDLLGLTTSGFAYTLAAGAQYVYVTTGFANTNFGQFSTTIGGRGTVTQVPEPASLALMALGLGALGFARRYSQPKSARASDLQTA